jgi:hypothetical protein
MCHTSSVEAFQANQLTQPTQDIMDLPEGSYVQSCRECGIDNNMLKCHCKNKEGKFNKMKTTINKDLCSRFRNVNGILLCE